MKKLLILMLALTLALSACAANTVNAPTNAPASPASGASSTPVQTNSKLTLAIAAYEDGFIPPEVNSLVQTFNADNPACEITVKSYAADKLTAEIIAGTVPDIIMTQGIPFDSWAVKGLFENLAPYIDAEAELELVPAYRTALSTGDALFRIGNSFAVQTSYGNAELVGAEPGWSFDEMLESLKNAPKNYDLLSSIEGQSREGYTEFLLYQNLDSFIDWESGEVYFDSPDFKKLLTFINGYPSRPEGSNLAAPEPKDPLVNRARYGRESVKMYPTFDNSLNGKLAFKGFPGDAKAVSALDLEASAFAISAASNAKDTAWRFIRGVVTAETGGGNIGYTFPVLKSEFDKIISAARSPVAENEALLINGKPREQMTQTQTDKFLNMLNSAKHVMGSASDDILRSIINDETGAYYAGQKTVDEVCEIIQSRASIYIAEQS
ncbi:MAG: extracellular solute-binding protein [Oscillospiraceae bacterium]|nr:extracellular solute-binding protein [Oscillospiraceae bacterium]